MSLDNSRDRSHEETLSALMDNEADELELRRLLKDLRAQPELAETWQRFHVARSVLHNEEMTRVSAASTSRIMAALAAEPAYEAHRSTVPSMKARSRIRPVWLETVGRVAIAASVALAAFVGLQSLLVDPQTGVPMAGSDAAPTSSVQIADSNEIKGFDAEAQRRLNDYIRSVSIPYGDEAGAVSDFNILQDSQLIRQVNQIELQPAN